MSLEDDLNLFWARARWAGFGGRAGLAGRDLVADVAVAESGAARSGQGAETPCRSQSEASVAQASRDIDCAYPRVVSGMTSSMSVSNKSSVKKEDGQGCVCMAYWRHEIQRGPQRRAR